MAEVPLMKDQASDVGPRATRKAGTSLDWFSLRLPPHQTLWATVYSVDPSTCVPGWAAPHESWSSPPAMMGRSLLTRGTLNSDIAAVGRIVRTRTTAVRDEMPVEIVSDDPDLPQMLSQDGC